MMSLTAIFKNRTQNSLNKTCLQTAFDGNFKQALDLVAQGADINSAGKAKAYGMMSSWKVETSLGHAAIKHSNFKALVAFLDKGLKSNIEAGGKPLLMYAIEQRQEDAALLLLDRGAGTDYVRNDLETPLSLAEKNGMHTTVQRIKALPQEAPAVDVIAAAVVRAMKPLTLKIPQ